MQVTLYAQPYDITAMGYSFSDIEGYRTKASALRNAAGDPDDLDIDIYWVECLRALAERFLENGYFGSIPDALSAYIDTDAIARDLAMDFAMIDIAGARLAYRAG